MKTFVGIVLLAAAFLVQGLRAEEHYYLHLTPTTDTLLLDVGPIESMFGLELDLINGHCYFINEYADSAAFSYAIGSFAPFIGYTSNDGKLLHRGDTLQTSFRIGSATQVYGNVFTVSLNDPSRPSVVLKRFYLKFIRQSTGAGNRTVLVRADQHIEHILVPPTTTLRDHDTLVDPFFDTNAVGSMSYVNNSDSLVSVYSISIGSQSAYKIVGFSSTAYPVRLRTGDTLFAYFRRDTRFTKRSTDWVTVITDSTFPLSGLDSKEGPTLAVEPDQRPEPLFVRIFPNPASSVVHILAPEGATGLEIFNSLGVRVFAIDAVRAWQQEFVVAAGSLTPGPYSVLVHGRDADHSGRFVIVRN